MIHENLSGAAGVRLRRCLFKQISLSQTVCYQPSKDIKCKDVNIKVLSVFFCAFISQE